MGKGVTRWLTARTSRLTAPISPTSFSVSCERGLVALQDRCKTSMVMTPKKGFSTRIRRAERSHHHGGKCSRGRKGSEAEGHAGGSVPPGVDGGGGRVAGELFGLLPTGGAGHVAGGHGSGGHGVPRADELPA